MDLLSRGLSNLPQVTIANLLSHATERNKQSKLSSSPPQGNKQNNHLLDVKEPFYVDRFKHRKHTDCHEQGKCLACLYGKCKAFELKHKKQYLHSDRSRIRKLNRVKTQRQSYNHSQHHQISLRKFRSSERTENQDLDVFFSGIIRTKISKLSEIDKKNLQALTNIECQDPAMVRIFLEYLKSSYKKKQKKQDNTILVNSTQLCQYLSSFDLKTLMKQKKFLAYVKKSGDRLKNEKSIHSFGQKIKATVQETYKRKLIDQCSIKLIGLENSILLKRKQRQNTSKVQKKLPKKVKIVDTESDTAGQNTQTRLICSKYFIDDQMGLSEQIKERLNALAKKQYKRFKGAVEIIDDYISEQVGDDPSKHEAMTKKLQIATGWIKTCIPETDKHENLKHHRLDKLYNSIVNLANPKRRKSSLKQLQISRQNYGASKFQNQKNEEQEIKQKRISRKSTAKSNKSKVSQKSDGFTNRQQRNQAYRPSQQYFKLSTKEQSLKGSDKYGKKWHKFQEDSEKLIEDEIDDQVIQQNEIIDASKKRSRKKSELKNSFLTHDKFQQILIDPDYELKNVRAKGQLKGGLKIQTSVSEKNKRQRVQREQDILPKKNQKVNLEKKSLIQAVENQKDRKKKVFLKMRAAELLKQNQELIQNAEKYLREVDLSKFIINPTDCVLTQKKKIRHLRQIIRIRSLSKQIEENIVNQILQYLSVYEENYQILMDKYPEVKNSVQTTDQFRLSKIVGKKEIYNDLLFYDLTNNDKFGRVEDEFVSFPFGAGKDKSWQISTKNIKSPLIFDTFVNILKRETQKITQLDNLVQMQLTQVLRPEAFGIAKLKQIRSCSISDQQRFLMTQNF